MPRTTHPPGRPDVALVVAQAATARVRGRGRRSPLYLWFRDNHDELVAAFDQNSPSWAKWAEVLGTHGVLDGDGKPPTARGARGAWARVRADVRKARERRANTTSSEQRRGGTASPAMPPPVEHSAKSEPGEPDFQLARAPAAAVPRPAIASAAAGPGPTTRDPDDVIAKLLARPRQGTIPMPPVFEPEEEE